MCFRRPKIIVILVILSCLSLLTLLPGWSVLHRNMTSHNFPDLTSSMNRHAPFSVAGQGFLPLSQMGVKERISYVKRRCTISAMNGVIHLNETNNVYVFINHEHKILACSNLKAASSTVASIFYKLLNISSSWLSYRKNFLQKTITSKTFNGYDYVKFMIVREPIEKLMSVYRESWAHPKINGTKRSFPMFMSDVGSFVDYSNDQHYMTTIERCRPCDAGYTYIGTIETLEKDLKTILASINFNISEIPVKNSKNTETHRRFLRKMLNNETLAAIWNRYKLDYQIFGFQYPT